MRDSRMGLISLRQVLDHAAIHAYGVAAFNVNNIEQIKAVLEAASETDSPIILQFSLGSRQYLGDTFIKHIIKAISEDYKDVPVVIHQDHGSSYDACRGAIELGFTSVMMDGSLKDDGKTPSDFDYNVLVTSKVVSYAHSKNVSVEGELGCLGSLETGLGEKEDGHGFEGKLGRSKLLTDPNEAQIFVEKTGVDALAIAIGTSHGAYKFSRKPDNKILEIQRIKEIHKKLPNTHLVMHGASSVPSILQEKFRAFGGEMPETWGVPVSEIQESIKNGVRKINVDTDNRLAMAAAMREFLKFNPSVFDLRKILKPAQDAMKDVCKERMIQFGQAGMASYFR